MNNRREERAAKIDRHFTAKDIIDDMALVELIRPSQVAYKVALAATATGEYVFSVPDGKYCLTQEFELYSDDPPNASFKVTVDDALLFDWRNLVPNRGPVTREEKFSGGWVKKSFLKFEFRNDHAVDSVVFQVRAEAMLIDEGDFTGFLWPLLESRYAHYVARALEVEGRGDGKVEYPISSKGFGAAPNPPNINANRRDPKTKGRAEVSFSGDVVSRVKFRDDPAGPAFWGQGEQSPLFTLTTRAEYNQAVAAGTIEEI